MRSIAGASETSLYGRMIWGARKPSRPVKEIVAALVEAHKQGKDVNLNRLKCDVS